MSSISFRTESDGSVDVRGTERAFMGVVCSDIAGAFIPRYPSLTEFMTRQGKTYFDRSGSLSTMYGEEEFFTYQGEPLQNFSLVLNTVLAIGNDPLCLYARLQGQCELHAYVEGPHRAWLADVIQQGLDLGLYRKMVYAHDTKGRPHDPISSGWDAAISLLRKRDTEPVVTSYSVTDSFPNLDMANCGIPLEVHAELFDEDIWEDMSDGIRWSLALAGLRSLTRDKLELRPDMLRAPFGHERTLFDVFGGDNENP